MVMWQMELQVVRRFAPRHHQFHRLPLPDRYLICVGEAFIFSAWEAVVSTSSDILPNADIEPLVEALPNGQASIVLKFVILDLPGKQTGNLGIVVL
jgi:hypothetical protein